MLEMADRMSDDQIAVRIGESGVGRRSIISTIASEVAWVCFGHAATAIGALIELRILTEFLSATGYGILALAVTACGMFQGVFFAGPGGAVLRNYFVARPLGQ